MESYPLVTELPPVVEPRDWEWKPFDDARGSGWGFFVGVDELGNAWLTKMRGSFYAYREIVFERLVQRCGWLCQSSSFAILESSSLPRQEFPKSESVQLVSRLLREHEAGDCGPDCPIAPVRSNLHELDGDPLKLLATSGLEDALNIAREDILAPLLGGNEPAGCLTTVDHRVFLIDGEQMFSAKPSDVRETHWWKRPDGSHWPAGQQLTREICATVGSLQDDELEAFLEKPKGVRIKSLWPIRGLLYKARDYGRAFAEGRFCS